MRQTYEGAVILRAFLLDRRMHRVCYIQFGAFQTSDTLLLDGLWEARLGLAEHRGL